jgi:hypothetical protein
MMICYVLCIDYKGEGGADTQAKLIYEEARFVIIYIEGERAFGSFLYSLILLWINQIKL